MCTRGMIIPNHISKYTLPLGKLKIFVDAIMEKQNIYHGNGTQAQLYGALAKTMHGLPFWRVCRFGIGRDLVHLILTLRHCPLALRGGQKAAPNPCTSEATGFIMHLSRLYEGT